MTTAPGLAPSCRNDQGLHKHGYYDKASARRAAKKTQSFGGGGRIHAYRGECGLYHIGHRTGRKAAA